MSALDDMLMYSLSLELHIQHLRMVLETLHKNQLFSNKSKCSSCKKKVEYLDHIIPSQGVAINSKKTKAIRN
jgi:hypothetical protein